MKYSLVLQQLNIVWVGPLSPYLFTPFWFEKYELLRKEDIDKAEVKLNHNSIFIDFGWVEITANLNRISFQLTKSGLEMALSDLVKSVITLLDNNTTIAIGINTNYIYKFENRDDWHKIGDEILPKNIWKETNKSKLISEDLGYHFGMKKVVLEIANLRTSFDKGRNFEEKINVTINSQPNIDDLDYGIQVNYNHDLKCINESHGLELTKKIPQILDQHVKNAISNDIETTQSLFDRILT